VELTFPALEATGDKPRSDANTSAPAATVLVVEDERAIREAAAAVLQSEGYHVILATDGEHALSVLRSEPDVDLIVSDVVMPKLGGVELYERLREQPEMPRFVLTSGYPATMLEGDLSEVRVLSKPWSVDTLIECVKEVLS
jgi:CheY-like chemotaxis protein